MLTLIFQAISLAVCIGGDSAFWCAAMERRWSVRKTAWGTAAFWAFICVLKLWSLTTQDILLMQAVNVILALGYLAFNVLGFRGSIPRRILVIMLVFVHMIAAELTTVRLTVAVTGSLNILDLESVYMEFGSLLIIPFYLLYFALLIWLWRQLAKVDWALLGRGGQWLCVLFPVSQFVLMDCYMQWSNRNALGVSWLMLASLALGVLGDYYMVRLFYRRSQKRRAERELQELKLQREKDRLYYESLLQKEKETARLRHDFQNYLLVLRSAGSQTSAEARQTAAQIRREAEDWAEDTDASGR